MKKILTLITILCLGYSAQATHLMGGEIIVTDLGNSNYEIKVTHYRDSLGIPLAPSIYVDVDTLDPATGAYTNLFQVTVDRDTNNIGTILPNFPYGIEVGIYVDTIMIAPGDYRLGVDQCCRNGAILNMTNPLNEGMYLYTDYSIPATGSNSTPNFNLMPINYFPVNTPITYNPLPVDVDGDSLSWSLNIPYSKTVMGVADTVDGFVAPSADATGPFTMNPVTGEITWTPDQVGNFVQSFEVNEYRNGVLTGTIIRDYQYVVITAPPGNLVIPEASVQSGNVQYNAAEEYYYIEYTPGVPLQFVIEGTDADATAQLNMISSSEIFSLPNPATFTTSVNGPEIVGTLDWTPPAGYNKNALVVFRLQDGLWTTDYTLRLQPDEPDAIDGVAGSLEQIVVYPNPASEGFTVSLNNTKSAEAQIEIHNYLGQKIDNIYSGNLPSGQWTLEYTEKLPTGMYFISVTDESGNTHKTPLLIK